MSRFLPDVNTLLALLDPMHVHHGTVCRWFESRAPWRMLPCPHVENGVIRVASQSAYPNRPGTSAQVRVILQNFISAVGAESCTSSISLLQDSILLKPETLTPPRIADLYLLALAVANGARLATLDQRIPAEAIAGGLPGIEIIPA